LLNDAYTTRLDNFFTVTTNAKLLQATSGGNNKKRSKEKEIMDIIKNLFMGSGAATAITYICLTGFIGIIIGKFEVKKIRLGIAGVLFTGLVFAHFGAKPDVSVISFIRDFGLILFVYAVGIDIGPRFFNTFKSEGLTLNLLAAGIVVLGFIIAFLLCYFLKIPPAVITGILCGATTNTPSLGAAQQVIAEHVGGSAAALSGQLSGMAYAVAYPFGVLGIILTMILVRIFFRVKIDKEVKDFNAQFENIQNKLESVKIKITNPNMFGRKIAYVQQAVDKELVISRIGRNGNIIVALEHEELHQGDYVYGVSALNHMDNLKLKMGEVEVIQKKEISGDLAMAHVLVTNRKLTGKTIEQIGIYRRYEANITRIFRAGMEILPTRSAVIELGDTVRIVGKKDLLDDVRSELGNSIKELAIPNIIPIFVGIFLGVVLGSIPIFIPGLPAPAKLGLAGGPLVIAILIGHVGRIGRHDFYMSPGAIMMLRELGITLFLACVGLLSGSQFVNTVYNGGYMWMLYGAIITFVPIMIISIIARLMKINYLKICGVISGAMTDPPALEFANSLAQSEAQSTAYATVYPLTMFLRILFAQILMLLAL
jgi:putative transport protein